MLPLNQIVLGDCFEVMRGLPDGCVDSVVTDPPYGLGNVKNLPALIQAWLSDEDGSAHQTSGFMGKDWDMVPSPTVWREVYRVLKPGGYALVFAGTRTVDLMGLSLRLAGFEIQDSIAWMQGQGFPKGKSALKPSFEPIIMAFKPGKRVLNVNECRIGVSVEDTHPTWNETNHQGGDYYSGSWGGDIKKRAAKVSGRYPANVILSHSPDCVACGTKRVKTQWGQATERTTSESSKAVYSGGWAKVDRPIGYTAPDGTETIAAYECHPSCPVRLLDEQTAQMRASKSGSSGIQIAPKQWFGNTLKETSVSKNYQDGDGTANASRFFLNLPPEVPFVYQPKASKKDRTCDGKVENTHCTVKPSNLMAYLVRLITPVNGICLDPFAGSGSTALGCIQEGRQFIGIERDPDYHRIACDRLAAASPQSAV